MPDYKRMYFQLAAKVADAIEILIEAQQRGENDDNEGAAPVLVLAKDESKEEDNRKND